MLVVDRIIWVVVGSRNAIGAAATIVDDMRVNGNGWEPPSSCSEIAYRPTHNWTHDWTIV